MLNERFGLTEIDELVSQKRAGAEKMTLDARELDQHGRILDRLELEVVAAHAASELPEKPTSAALLDDFVVNLRLEAARAG